MPENTLSAKETKYEKCFIHIEMTLSVIIRFYVFVYFLKNQQFVADDS